MPITFTCTGCAKRYEVGDDLAGKRGRCKQCGTAFQIPVPRVAAPRPAPPPARAPVPEARPRDEDEDIPLDPFGDLGEDEGEDYGAAIGPRLRSRPKRSGSASGFLKNLPILIAGVVGLFLLFLVVSFIAFRNSRGGSPDQRLRAAHVAGVSNKGSVNPDRFPKLPPAPEGVVSIAKYPPMNDVARNEEAMRNLVALLNQAADEFAKIHDRRSAQEMSVPVAALDSQLKIVGTSCMSLRRIQSPPAAAEVAKRVQGPLQDAIARLQSEFKRIGASEVGAERAAELEAGLQSYVKLLQSLRESASKFPDEPYLEVFVSNVPNEQISRAFETFLRSMVEHYPSESQSAWDETTQSSSYRLWPVASAQSFASRYNLGGVVVSGHRVFIEIGPALLEKFAVIQAGPRPE